jgi:hypothetical protein
MPGFLSSLPFLAPLTIGNYAKNIHLAYRMLEVAGEQVYFVLSQYVLHVCTLVDFGSECVKC